MQQDLLLRDVLELDTKTDHRLPGVVAHDGGAEVVRELLESGRDLVGCRRGAEEGQQAGQAHDGMQVAAEAPDGGVLGLSHPGQRLRRHHVHPADQDLDFARRSEHVLGVLRVGQGGHALGEPVRPGFDIEKRKRRPAQSRDSDKHDQHTDPACTRHRRYRLVVRRWLLDLGVHDPVPEQDRQPDGHQDTGRERESEVPDERHRRQPQGGKTRGAGQCRYEHAPRVGSPDQVGREVAADPDEDGKEGDDPERERMPQPPEGREREHCRAECRDQGQQPVASAPHPGHQHVARGDQPEGQRAEQGDLAPYLPTEIGGDRGHAGDGQPCRPQPGGFRHPARGCDQPLGSRLVQAFPGTDEDGDGVR